MKNSEKKLLIINTIFITIFVLTSSICIDIILMTKMLAIMKSIIILIIIMFISIFSYFLSKFLLVRLFETNHLLDLLLKDTLHELNIPLSVIKANTQMLQLQENSEKNLKKIQRINQACGELYNLYEDVDYYIQKEMKNDIRENLKLDDLLKSEIEKFKTIYPKTDISFKQTNLEIVTDKRGFGKIIGNLLSNALKYNRNNNKIEIYLKENRLIIQDEGIGMSESELFGVFNRYYQGTSQNQGFGIGLNIVKAFCDENKIFINIESKKGIGTKIGLDLKNLI
ncbi:MAG: HAMP domain-containing histidine kinase [Campylobacteraceae bacterium]|nr:HAMP domain-containing histidine kinase [Campylobacteraceae bacterium]